MKEINLDFHQRFPTKDVKQSQNYTELKQWLEWIQKEWGLDNWNTRGPIFKYLEIGSYAGESLYYVSQVLPRGSTIVLCDLGDNSTARQILYSVIDYVVRTYNHYVPLISGDSTAKDTIQKVTDQSETYNLCFIDGNHTFDIALQDYENYGPLTERVSFHDISQANIERDVAKYPPRGQPLVSHLWKGIKAAVQQQEQVGDNGLGGPQIVLDNWFEIIAPEGVVKPRGFGVIYGGKFG